MLNVWNYGTSRCPNFSTFKFYWTEKVKQSNTSHVRDHSTTKHDLLFIDFIVFIDHDANETIT